MIIIVWNNLGGIGPAGYIIISRIKACSQHSCILAHLHLLLNMSYDLLFRELSLIIASFGFLLPDSWQLLCASDQFLTLSDQILPLSIVCPKLCITWLWSKLCSTWLWGHYVMTWHNALHKSLVLFVAAEGSFTYATGSMDTLAHWRCWLSIWRTWGSWSEGSTWVRCSLPVLLACLPTGYIPSLSSSSPFLFSLSSLSHPSFSPLVGHGRSGGDRGHIDSIESYVTDVVNHIKDTRAEFSDPPLFLFGLANVSCKTILFCFFLCVFHFFSWICELTETISHNYPHIIGRTGSHWRHAEDTRDVTGCNL